MGTSSSNPGPKGTASLLPPWAPAATDGAVGGAADEPADNAESNAPEGQTSPLDDATAPNLADLANAGSWIVPRRLVGRLAASSSTGHGARADLRRAVGGAVRAMGGPRGATRASGAGRSTARGLGGFLAAAAAGGVAAAAAQFGLAEYLGRGARVFLTRLVDTLGPDGALTEDVVARAALTATVEELEDRLDLDAAGLEALDSLTPEMIRDALVSFVTHYVYERLLAALANQIATRALDPARVRQVEREAWRYLEEAVRADLPDRLPMLRNPQALVATRWDGAAGQAFVDRLFAECYAVVEVDL